MKSWWLIGGIVVALLAAAMVWSRANGGLTVETAAVRSGLIRQFVDETAKTRLPEIHRVTMPFDGRVKSIDLIEGAPVKKGDVVARIDPDDLRRSNDAAKATVARLDAAIRENDDTSVESFGKRQAVSYVESMDATVKAAARRMESGKAKFDYAQEQFERVKSVHARGGTTDQALDTARLAVVEGRVSYQQDVLIHEAMRALQAATALMPAMVDAYIARKQELAHDVLDRQRDEATIKREQVAAEVARGEMRSPIDGVVLERPISNERHLMAGTLLLEIGRLEELEVEADILSQDVVHVKIGDPVDVEGAAIGATPAKGKVARVFPAGFTKLSSLGVEQQRVRVIVRFDGADISRLIKEQRLGVGYRVRVRIYTAQRDDALIIPRSALFRGKAGGWQVFAVQDGLASLRTVDIGLMNDEQVEVVSGLNAGEEVILAPESQLTDGTRVRPVDMSAERE